MSRDDGRYPPRDRIIWTRVALLAVALGGLGLSIVATLLRWAFIPWQVVAFLGWAPVWVLGIASVLAYQKFARIEAARKAPLSGRGK